MSNISVNDRAAGENSTGLAAVGSRPQADSLPAGTAKVWLVHTDQVQDPVLLARYAELLSDEERLRWRRFRFAQHRHQFLLTRALVRTTLSRYAAVDPADWTFSANHYGRPTIAGRFLRSTFGSETPPLQFNLSHADGLIACAVTVNGDIGVDVECCDRQAETVAIADRFFSTSECAELRRLPLAAQHDGFFDYWTLKESYIKARGMGLALPLGQFSFDLNHSSGQIRIAFDERIADDPNRWRFWLRRPTTRHRLAICLDPGPAHAASATIDIQPVIPMDGP